MQSLWKEVLPTYPTQLIQMVGLELTANPRIEQLMTQCHELQQESNQDFEITSVVISQLFFVSSKKHEIQTGDVEQLFSFQFMMQKHMRLPHPSS